MPPLLPESAIIDEIIPQTPDTTLFRLLPKERVKRLHAADFSPGQFLQLSLPGAGEIPVSYCGAPGEDGCIELCIKKAGHVTEFLHSRSIGSVAGVHGAYGNGFPLGIMAGHDIVLIAGGLGIAPIRSLLMSLLTRASLYRSITLLYGARTPDQFVFRDELILWQSSTALKTLFAVDRSDGVVSSGTLSYTTGMLNMAVAELSLHEGCIAALCVPPAAYPGIITELKKQGVEDENIHLSLERRMQCGVGRCAHCAVGTMLCCQDGPVFSYAGLRGIQGAI